MGWLRRLRDTFRPDSVDGAIDEELRFHLEQRRRDLETRGMRPPDAERFARQRLGSVSRLKEDVRTVDALPWLDDLRRDARHAGRALLRSYGFVLVVLSLGLAIGATAAVYLTAHWLLDRPSDAVIEPDRLVTLRIMESGRTDLGEGFGTSIPQYRALQDVQDAFSGMAAFGKIVGVVADELGADQIVAEVVTGSYFPLLGVRPQLGRLLSPADDVGGTAPVLVLSQEFWQRRFGGDLSILGRTVRLNGTLARVVGVAPPDFTGYSMDWNGPTSMWLPLQSGADIVGLGGLLDNERVSFFPIIGRMRDGVTIEQVRERAQAWLPQLPPVQQASWTADTMVVDPTTNMRLGQRGDTDRFFRVLLTVCALVLIAACFSLANFLLGRALQRRREMAVRRALGASHARLIRQLCTEMVVVGLAAGLTGGGIAYLGMRALAPLPRIYLNLGSLATPLTTSGAIDVRVLGLTLALGFAAALLFGLLPLLPYLVRQPAAPMKAWMAPWRISRVRLTSRQAVLTFQVALSIVLAVTAGLYARGFASAAAVDSLYEDPEQLLVARVVARSMEPARLPAFYAALFAQLDARQDVVSASIGWNPPYRGGITSIGRAGTPEEDLIQTRATAAAPRFFETLGVPVLEGREFAASDGLEPRGIVINQVLADELWPGEPAVGKVASVRGTDEVVLGVVADDRCDDLLGAPTPCLWRGWSPSVLSYLRIRTTEPPLSLVPPLRQIVRELDPGVAIAEVTTMDTVLSEIVGPQRMAATASAAFSVLGVILLVSGTTALFLAMVRDGAKDLSIRMALGARPWRLVRRLLFQGAFIVLVGGVVGLAVAYAVALRIASQLFDVAPSDPAAFLLVPAAVAVAGLLAVGYAALVATRTDPVRHLHID